MKSCPEFLDANSPPDIEVYQLTPGEASSSPVYPDSPGFVQDGRSIILRTAGGPQICRIDEGGALQPLRDLAPDMRRWLLAPDGRHVVFTRGEQRPGRLDLCRLDLRTGKTEAVFHAEGMLKGSLLPVDRLFIETVCWDGSRMGALAYLDYDRRVDGNTGIVVIDTHAGKAEVVFSQLFPHAHLRYFTEPSKPGINTFIVQHHHDYHQKIDGKPFRDPWSPNDRGVDLHVLRDDGTHWSDLPFGRDGLESCIGHQVWRGPDGEVASVMLHARDNTYGWADGTLQYAVSGLPVPSDPQAEHCGCMGREAYRHNLSQPENSPRLCHLSADRSGRLFAFDTFPVWSGERAGMAIYTGQADRFGEQLTFRYILNSGTDIKGGVHAHPVLAPDGKALYFASNYFGTTQAYMVVNLPWDKA